VGEPAARAPPGGSGSVKAKAGVLIAAALVAWGLKRHYSAAQADELWWVLAPPARLVEGVTGATFTVAPGEGYFARDRLFLIEKSCAGINFMVAAFGMLACTLFHRVRAGVSATQVLGVSLVASYVAAVVVNATRVAIAMGLAAQPLPLSSLSADSVHRIEGIAVYFGGLILVYELVAKRLARR
jgi:exosortase K